MAQPPRIPPSSRLAGTTCVATAIPAATSMPVKIPLPPSSGVDRVCQRSARGAATTWRAAGVLRSAQIASRLAGRAAKAAAVTVTGEGYSWAVKRVYGQPSASLARESDVETGLLELLRCPVCRAPVTEGEAGLACTACGRAFGLEDGIPLMLHEDLPGAREKL